MSHCAFNNFQTRPHKSWTSMLWNFHGLVGAGDQDVFKMVESSLGVGGENRTQTDVATNVASPMKACAKDCGPLGLEMAVVTWQSVKPGNDPSLTPNASNQGTHPTWICWTLWMMRMFHFMRSIVWWYLMHLYAPFRFYITRLFNVVQLWR